MIPHASGVDSLAASSEYIGRDDGTQQASSALREQTSTDIRALFQQAVVVRSVEEVVSEPPPNETTTVSSRWRPLPESAQLAPELGADASPWLDRYTEFSRKWSPRAFDDFHEAIALWLLSTIAARRVTAHLGGPRYTNLMLALAARTSLYGKSTTARIGAETLDATGLSYLLAPDDSTPQAFLQALALRVPENWQNLTSESRARAELRLAFAGQRGWFYEEFGQKVSAMMKDGGVMADFRGILRRFDDCPEQHEDHTIGRGSTILKRPYVALLANLTPADLRPFAKRGAALWNDGFWARFAFITPPPDYERKIGRFPVGKRVIPGELVAPLLAWHKRLGIPEVTIVPAKRTGDAAGGAGEVTVTEVSPQVCTLGKGVVDAFYNYDVALGDLVEASDLEDLDGSYTRFAEKALRVAMLFGSLGNEGHIEMRHWARAQQVAERWRLGLHNLYDAVNESSGSSKADLAERVMTRVAEQGSATAADVKRFFKTFSVDEIAKVMNGLVEEGKLRSETTQKGTLRYCLPNSKQEIGETRDRREIPISSPV